MEKLSKRSKYLTVGIGVTVIAVALLLLPMASGTSLLSSLISAKADPPAASVVTYGEEGAISVANTHTQAIWTTSGLPTGCAEKVTVSVTSGSVSMSPIPVPNPPSTWPTLQVSPYPVAAGQSMSMDVGGTGFIIGVTGTSTAVATGYYVVSTPTCNPSSAVFCEWLTYGTTQVPALVAQASNITPIVVTINDYLNPIRVSGSYSMAGAVFLNGGMTATWTVPFSTASGWFDQLYVAPPAVGVSSFVCDQTQIDSF